MKIVVSFLAGFTLVVGGFFIVNNPKEALSAFTDPFVSVQLAPSPSNGNCLTTDGTANAWGDCGTGTGGTGSNWTLISGGLRTSTSTDFAQAAYFNATSTLLNSIFPRYTATYGTTTNATSTTFSTNALTVTGNGTTTFAGGLNIGANHIVAHGAAADGSDGFHIDASNGTQVVNLGAGGTANATFAGGVNIDGATRLATSLNGFGYLTNGAVTATTSGATLTLSRIGNSTYSTLQHLQDIFHSAGWISGGVIADITGGNVSVATGTGLIRGVNVATGTISYFDWSASSTISIPTDTYRYIGVEYNAGSPRIVAHTTYDWNFKTDFPLGSVVNIGGTLHIENSPFAVGDHAANMILREIQTMPYERDEMAGGLILGETGTRDVTLSTGAVWQGLTRFSIPAVDTSAASTFTSWVYNGSVWSPTTGVGQWPNTEYNNLASGLVTMSGNFYANLWFYMETDGDMHMLYGTNEYATLAGAEAEGTPSTIPDKISVHSWLVGRIIFQKSDAAAEEIQSVYTQTFSATAASNHANLSNLAWTSSGHTGTASTLAGFDGSGLATSYGTTGSGDVVLATNPLMAGFRSSASSTIGDGTGAGGLTVNGKATSTQFIATGGNTGATSAFKFANENTGIGQISAGYMSFFTGTAGNESLRVSTLGVYTPYGFITGASSTIAALTVTTGTTTNATSTTLAVTTAFNFLGDIITNVATWFSTKLNAVSSFVAAASSTWDFSAASLVIPNGASPTVNATGETALNTTTNALSVATSTTALELPLAPQISFAYASSSWTATTTEISRPTGATFDELVTTGICFANGTGKIHIGNGTASSTIVALSAGTTTVAVNQRFNKNGTRIIFAIGTPTTLSTVNCTFDRYFLR